MVSNNTYTLSPNVHKRREILIKKFSSRNSMNIVVFMAILGI